MRTKRWIGLVAVCCGLVCAPVLLHAQTALPAEASDLLTLDNQPVDLSGITGEAATAIIFWSNQCPWVQRYESRIAEMAAAYASRGVRVLLVNANDTKSFPQEGVESSRAVRSRMPTEVQYLVDPGSRLAKALEAERTPEVFLFDGARALRYQGAIDDSPGDPSGVQAHYLLDALNAVLGASTVSEPETKPFGCAIRFQ